MKKLTEIEVSRIWQRVAKDNTAMSTVDKQKVQVVYPGRPSDEQGADFKDAVIDIGGKLTKGDVEVHVRSSDWCTHRHHKNQAYNGIVLHVVMYHNADEKTCLENGNSIPIIALENQEERVTTGSEMRSVRPCSIMKSHGMNEKRISYVLDVAGEARFREKQSVFHHELMNKEAGQCLYEGIMSALGYSRNPVPFQFLAQKLPLALLEEVIEESTAELVCSRLQALLLGTAGFLPGQESNSYYMENKDTWVLNLEKEWQFSQRSRELFSQDWHLFRVRPANFPARRLAGLAYLLQRYQRHGLLAGIFEKIELFIPVETWRLLEEALVVLAADYWIDHFSPGKQCQRLGRFLIGPSRAAEILVNIVFPFYAAYAAGSCHPEIGEKAFDLYCGYPGIDTNTVCRHMCRQLGLKPSQVNSACRQQGLLHLYKNFCTQGKCSECLLLVG